MCLILSNNKTTMPETCSFDHISPGTGGGSSFRICCMRVLNEVFMKGGVPTEHSYRTQPRDHRSEAVE